MFEKILACIDGSEPSLQALKYALDLSIKYGSELTVLSVIGEMTFPFAAQYGLWAKESHEELLRKVLENLNSSIMAIKENHPDLRIKARIEEGRPATKIIEIAEDEEYDLIVLGRHGYGKVKEWILGSVSNEVVARSKKTVLVIK